MEDRDIAIIELAHVASCLATRLVEVDSEFSGIIQEAISNKVDYYAGFARAANTDQE